MVETFTNFQENGDIRWQLGPMNVNEFQEPGGSSIESKIGWIYASSGDSKEIQKVGGGLRMVSFWF